MKKKPSKYFWLVLLLSTLPLLPILLNPLLVHTHDGLVHLPRMAAWFKAFKDGQLPVRWAADLNYGYGTPVLIFMYPWPYFLSALFLTLGANLVSSFKLTLTLSYLLAGVFMFAFAKTFFKDEKKAFFATILYQFASFRLIEMITRGALGEVWTYTFTPLVLLGLVRIFIKRKLSGFLLAGIGTGLLVLSHNSISLSFFLVLLLFVLIFGKGLTSYLWGFTSLGLGLGLSAFYWLPALWERKYTYGDLFMRDLYLEHFPTIKQLFLPNLLNRSSGQIHNIPVQIGIIHLLALALGVFFLLKRKLKGVEKKVVIFSLIIFFVGLFLMQPVSIPFWARLSLLRQFQFSWRLLSLIVLATALAGFSFFKIGLFKKGAPFWLLVLLVVLSSLAYWFPPEGFDRIDEEHYWNFPLNTTYFGEANTIWAGNPPEQYPDEEIKIIEGEGEISGLVQDSTSQQFFVKAKTEVNVLSHTLFFPGWRVFASGGQLPIEFQDPNYRGLITFRLPSGEHQVEIKFGRTKDRIIAEGISLTSFGFLLFGIGVLGYNIRYAQAK